jgi:carbamoylphosphate synthase small subunit
MDVLKATFPAGTLTGAPKVHAMELIDQLEPTKRGLYGGACGYISYAGDMDVAIAIRTGLIKDQTLYVQAAAGVVADSVPEMEWRRPNTRRAPCCARRTGGRRTGVNAMTNKIKLLMVDNYDSFTFNIVQYFGELGAEVEVFRNDEITLEGIARARADRLVISPGPCSPAEAGISVAAIQHFAGKLPILGVCLGHQRLARPLAAHRARQQLMHGKTSVITTTREACSPGCPSASR